MSGSRKASTRPISAAHFAASAAAAWTPAAKWSPCPPGPLINLGEADAPADGAEWIASEDWSLAAKLSADFDLALVARLDASNETVLARVNGQWRPQHFSLSIGGDIVKALGKARGGLLQAEEKTGNALARSFLAVDGALRAAATFVGATLEYER